MRIAVVTTSYPTYEGDPAGHFVEAEVSELQHAGNDVTVIRPKAGGAFGWPGVAPRMRENPLRMFEAAGWIGWATARLAAARVERVVAHWSVPSAFPIAMNGTRSTVELDVVSHGGDVRLLLGLPLAMRRLFVDRIAVRATRWRFVSRTLLEDLLRALPIGETLALERIAHVAPSTLGVFDVAAESKDKKRAIGSRRLYVCAGRLVASKRVDKVIDYVASRNERDSLLVVLGDGPERVQLEHMARRWRLDTRFLGTMPRRETLSWIGAADELVHASQAEGLSTVVREAERLGVPVTILP